MRYFGGKQRISNILGDYINTVSNNQFYYEPFVGGCNIVPMLKHFDGYFCSDANIDLIYLYNALKDGWLPPDHLSVEEYKLIKLAKPSALRAFVGFGCSYAGKWFGGYAKDKTGRNYCLNAKNSLLKRLDAIKKCEFSCRNFDSFYPKDSLIYCDPPYSGTSGYGYFKTKFNHVYFWEVVRRLSKQNTVLVSEYEAPDDFNAVLSITTKTDIRNSQGLKSAREEKLFQYKYS